jgi:hypothetical protein
MVTHFFLLHTVSDILQGLKALEKKKRETDLCDESVSEGAKK